MIWKLIITALSAFGTIWFGRLAYIAANTDDYACYPFAVIAIICVLIAIGFGLWTILSQQEVYGKDKR